MKAIILAAGSSKRLRPICDHMPKSMIEIRKVSLIERNIKNLLDAGITDITIVIGYLKDILIEKVKSIYKKAAFVENSIYQTTGSGYSLYLGIEHVTPVNDILFMDADILFHPQIIKDVNSNKGLSYIYTHRHECDKEAVKVVPDKEGRLMRLSKVIADKDICVGESIGIVRLNKITARKAAFLLKDEIYNRHNAGIEWEEIFDKNAKELPLAINITELPYIEIDFPEDIVRAEAIAKAFKL